jgi:hypothetical protein
MALANQSKPALRAYWLLLEAREMVSPSEYLNALSCAPQDEVQLLTKKLSRRADSTSLSLLTFLLADKRTAPAAAAALASLKEKGVAYLLDALSDPSPEIRLNVADLLKFCRLPRKYALQVRKNLREAKVRTHEARAAWVTPDAEESRAVGVVSGLSGTLGGALVPAAIFWLASRLVGSQTTFGYWIGYGLWRGTTLPTTDESQNWWMPLVERLAFGNILAVRDEDFWLARGRLERALGRQVEAKDSLRESLRLRPDSATTRLELALVQRSLRNLKLAQETLDADDRKYLTKDSELEALRRLLTIEEGRVEDPASYDEREHLRLLDRMGLWPEAQYLALAQLRQHGYLAEAGLALFHAYRGSKQTRRALAAAVAYNDRVSEQLAIRQVELEDLQWRHRLDAYPAVEIGRFEMAIDLNSDEVALNVLQALEILPESGAEVGEDYITRIQQLPPDVQAEIGALLSRAGDAEAALRIIKLMPLQQREELRRG